MIYISEDQIQILISTLKERFEKNMKRHENIIWDKVVSKLLNDQTKQKLSSLYEMEKTGGEPDVIGVDTQTGQYLLVDCSLETPLGRRNTCYDDEALASRKKFKPERSALGMATEMGIELLSEDEYYQLQKIGSFDTKTSSWIKTPEELRKLGGALFGERRYKRVFTFHNGAESYYSARGFRGKLRV